MDLERLGKKCVIRTRIDYADAVRLCTLNIISNNRQKR